MQMSRTSTRTSNADMQSATFQTNGDVAGQYADQDFDQRDRYSGPDGDQTCQ